MVRNMPNENDEKGTVYATEAQLTLDSQIQSAPDGSVTHEIEFQVSSQEWARAKKIVEQNPTITQFKIRRKDNDNLSQSFLCIDGKLYAMSPKGTKLIGMGEFGKTKLGTDENGHIVAIKIQHHILKNKVANKHHLPKKEKETEFEAELGRLHGSFSRDSISKKDKSGKTLTDIEGQEKKYQVVEYLGYSLRDILNGKVFKEPLTQEQNIKIAQGLLHAVKAFHDKNNLHCDIHPGNICVNFINGEPKVSLIDFGQAVKLSENNKNIHLSAYMASKKENNQPQVFNKAILPLAVLNRSHPYLSASTDIYALGLIFKYHLKLPLSIYEKMLDFEKKDAVITPELISNITADYISSHQEKTTYADASILQDDKNKLHLPIVYEKKLSEKGANTDYLTIDEFKKSSELLKAENDKPKIKNKN